MNRKIFIYHAKQQKQDSAISRPMTSGKAVVVIPTEVEIPVKDCVKMDARFCGHDITRHSVTLHFSCRV
jgi:hypothetical protein